MTGSLYEQAFRNELSYWPGVNVEFGHRGKHRQAVLHFSGDSRFVVYPDTPSDSARGHLNALRDLRKELSALGAKRQDRKPSKRKRGPRVARHSAPRQPAWVSRVEHAPVKANPFEALTAIQFHEPRKGRLREALKQLAGSVRRIVARFRRNAPSA